MHLKILIILIVAAAVLAAPFCVTGEAGIVTTASRNSPGFINILSFLGFVPSSLTGQLKVAFCNHDSLTSDDSSLKKRNDSLATDDGVATIAIICILVEALVIFLAILVAVYSCILWRRKRRGLQQEVEREYAAQILSAHPQPVDIELGAMNGSSVPQWPLVTPPNTPEHQDAEGSGIQPGTSAGPGAYGHGIQTGFSQAGNSEAAIPEIYVTDTEASRPEPNNLEPGIVAPHTHVGGSRLELGIDRPTYYSTFYRPDAEATGNNPTDSPDPEERLLTPTTSQQAAKASLSEPSSQLSSAAKSPN
ncbi:hypothetical protein CIB48_g6496 [Xylaria polymorpha]|nr:hypothetical protein CIB48_g6496 [Xylaria polymorpha]